MSLLLAGFLRLRLGARGVGTWNQCEASYSRTGLLGSISAMRCTTRMAAPETMFIFGAWQVSNPSTTLSSGHTLPGTNGYSKRASRQRNEDALYCAQKIETTLVYKAITFSQGLGILGISQISRYPSSTPDFMHVRNYPCQETEGFQQECNNAD